MPVTLTRQDLSRLSALHPRLEEAVLSCAEYCDQPFVVFEGMRTKARQASYVRKGVSKTMRSYHLVGLAVDLVPLMPDAPDKNGKTKLIPVWNAAACRIIAMAMAKAVKELQDEDPTFPDVKWGGTWKFFDGPHFQLEVEYKAHPRTEAYLAGVPYNHQPIRPAASVGSYANASTQPRRDPDRAGYAVPHDDVKAIQRGVNEVFQLSGTAGYPMLEVDGRYGKATETAVAVVQGILGVTRDGLWGPKTQKAYAEYVTRIVNYPPTKPDETPLTLTPLTSQATAATPVPEQGVYTTPKATSTERTPFMQGKKTYIVALGAILAAAGGYMQDQLSLMEALTLGVNALLAATLRNGIATSFDRVLGR